MLDRWFKRRRAAIHGSNGSDTATDTHLIQLQQVKKIYESAAGAFTALKGIDLEIDRGEFVAVIGKSGSGKSTLINMITGIDRPTSGEVLVAGTPVQTLSEGQMAVWRGRAIGVVFQFFQLLPTLTLVENVMLPMDFCGMYTPRERRTRAMEPARADGDGRARRQAAFRDLGRPAATRGDRSRAGQRPTDPGGRRADRQPRLEDRRVGLSYCSSAWSSRARPF